MSRPKPLKGRPPRWVTNRCWLSAGTIPYRALIARGLSYWLVRLGKDEANKGHNAPDRRRHTPVLGEARADKGLDFPQGGCVARGMERNVRVRRCFRRFRD
jgi:hypothetical protein